MVLSYRLVSDLPILDPEPHLKSPTSILRHSRCLHATYPPAEIRSEIDGDLPFDTGSRIFRNLPGTTTSVVFGKGIQTNLLQVDKALHALGTIVLYEQNTFTFTSMPAMKCFMLHYPMAKRHLRKFMLLLDVSQIGRIAHSADRAVFRNHLYSISALNRRSPSSFQKISHSLLPKFGSLANFTLLVLDAAQQEEVWSCPRKIGTIKRVTQPPRMVSNTRLWSSTNGVTDLHEHFRDWTRALARVGFRTPQPRVVGLEFLEDDELVKSMVEILRKEKPAETKN